MNSKNIVKALLICFAVIAVGVDVAWIYCKITFKPITNQVAYVGQLEVADVEEKPYFAEVNLFENKNENGIELQEIKFTHLNDRIHKQPIVTGYQYIGDYKNKFKPISSSGHVLLDKKDGSEFVQTMNTFDTWLERDFNWYDGFDGEYWPSARSLRHDEYMLVSIDDELFGLKLDKSKLVKHSKFWFLWNEKKYEHETFGTLFEYLMRAVKENTYNVTHVKQFVLPIRLADFFSIYRYDSDKDRWSDKEIGADQEQLHMHVKINYEANGAVLASQSLFKAINYDPLYGGDVGNVDFWNFGVQYQVTNNDFTTRYSTVHDGMFLTLKSEIAHYLRNTERLSAVDVVIDLSKYNNVIGLDFDVFNEIELRDFTILGSGMFHFLDRSLVDTQLKELRHNAGVEITYGNNATNNSFKVVVI